MMASSVDKNNKNSTQIIDYYDEVLPRADPKFMQPIRRLEKRMGFVTPIRWTSLSFIVLLHILSILYSIYSLYFGATLKWKTIIFEFFCIQLSAFGVTGGVHRYWTHRTYKAVLPLQIILMVCFSFAGQNSIPEWVRDHRVHHKTSDTAADPHDASRGLFFSHVGWLMMKKHPLVIRQGRKIDMSDILNDPLVQFHTTYFKVFKILFCYFIPTMIPIIFWGERWDLALTSSVIRYIYCLNVTWSVNSFAHLYGHKPYDTTIMPSENWIVSYFSMGEGWHNFHHTFPGDYKAAELPYFLNFTGFCIDCFSRIGWAYDLKTTSPSLIKAVSRRKGPKS